MISSFHDTTLGTPSLGLTHSFARYFQRFMVVDEKRVSKVSITLTAGDPSIVLDAGRNGRAGIAQCFAPVLRISPATLVTRGAHVSFSHCRCQVGNDEVMPVVIQQVNPLRCGYLTVKHDVVASWTRIHHYPIL
jgi:hypothetical protein